MSHFGLAGHPARRELELLGGIAPFNDLRPVKKFTDRKVATTRIWDALQRLAPVAPEGAQGAPESPLRPREHPGRKTRADSKRAVILELLRRPNGVTLAAEADRCDSVDRSPDSGPRPSGCEYNLRGTARYVTLCPRWQSALTVDTAK